MQISLVAWNSYHSSETLRLLIQRAVCYSKGTAREQIRPWCSQVLEWARWGGFKAVPPNPQRRGHLWQGSDRKANHFCDPQVLWWTWSLGFWDRLREGRCCSWQINPRCSTKRSMTRLASPYKHGTSAGMTLWSKESSIVEMCSLCLYALWHG